MKPLPSRFVDGNRVRLLEGGEQFFPRLLEAIDGSRFRVHLETYLFADDAVGVRVVDALARAARRGVRVRVVVDGYGSADAAAGLVERLRANGAQARIYRPQRGWRLEPRLLRRLHRKIAVVDDGPAFVGGINIIDDYNPADGADSPPGPRFDFAVACDGPIVAAISLATERLWWGMTAAALYPPAGPLPRLARQRRPPTIEGGVRARLLLRDNFRNRRTIERAYLDAIGRAERDVTIACAYFLPGRRFRAALVAAAARGVRVRLLLQGRVEYAVQHRAQEALYGRLLAAGIEIHAYKPGFLHAKAAVVDGAWATVGSSNIDPFSLLLAREANLCVDDEDFAEQLRAALDRAIDGPSTLVAPADYERRGWIRRALGWAALAFVRLAVSVLARDGDY